MWTAEIDTLSSISGQVSLFCLCIYCLERCIWSSDLHGQKHLYAFSIWMIQLSISHKIVNIKSQMTFHFFVIGHFGLVSLVRWDRYLYIHVLQTGYILQQMYTVMLQLTLGIGYVVVGFQRWFSTWCRLSRAIKQGCLEI